MKTARRRAVQVADRLRRAVQRRVPARARPTDRVHPALVWGADPASDRVVRCLAGLGLRPLGLVDPHAPRDAQTLRGGLPVWSPEAAAEQLKPGQTHAGAAILLNGPESGVAKPGQASFDERLDALQQSEALNAIPRRHAACLDTLRPFESKRLLINGFPGSGNMLLQRTFDLIRPLAPAVAMPEWEQLLGQFAWEAGQQLAEPIDQATADRYPRARRKTLAIATAYGSRYHFFDEDPDRVDKQSERRQALLFGLPVPSALWGTTQSTHEPLTPGVLDYYQHRGFRTALIVRHPLDALVSNAAKLTNGPSGRDPLSLLDHPGWLESMLGPLTAYFRHYAGLLERVTLFRYEEAMQCPAEFVRRAAQMMDFDPTDDQVNRLWAEIDGKPVSHLGQGHFWRPGAGKYAEFMQERHIQAIRASGLTEAAEALGYPIDFDAIANNTQPADHTPRNLAGVRYSLADHRYRGVMGKPIVFPHPEIAHREHGPFHFSCNDPHAFGTISAALDGQPLARLCRLFPDPPGVGTHVCTLLEQAPA
ncbi:MAG: hypothetical protein AAF288_00105 [Planctomycetota bacterium]